MRKRKFRTLEQMVAELRKETDKLPVLEPKYGCHRGNRDNKSHCWQHHNDHYFAELKKKDEAKNANNLRKS